jgi:autotransporter-associated beta strand protein
MRFDSKKTVRRTLILALLASAAAGTAGATDGVWTNNNSGSWWDPNNWALGAVADGTNAVAAFHTVDITAARTVTNDAPVTVGTAVFGDLNNNQDWTLTGMAFTLAADGAKGLLMVSNRTLNVFCQVRATNGFVKTGSGAAVFKDKSNDYTGVVELAAGSVTFYESTFGSTGTLFVVSNGCAVAFAADTVAGFTNIYTVTQPFATGIGGGALRARSSSVTFPDDGQIAGTETLTLANDGNGHLVFGGANRTVDGPVVIGAVALDNGTVQVDRRDGLGATNPVELIAAAAGRAASMLVANYSGFNDVPAEELARFRPGCTGVLSLVASTANTLDFSNAGCLSLASAVAGTLAGGGISIGGTLAAGADNTFRFGGRGPTLGFPGLLGGAGKLDMDTVLADPGPPGASNHLFVGYGGLVSLNRANTLSGTVVAGPSPDGRATVATLYLNHAHAAQNALSLTASGTSAVHYGAILLDPSLPYTGPAVSSANGAIGWTGSVSLPASPFVLATNTAAGSAGVTPVKILHLGGPYSAGTMSQTASWTVSDDGGVPVELGKSGTNSVLDLTGAPAAGNTFTGGARVNGGTLVFSDPRQFGAGSSGLVQIAQTGVLQLKAGSGNVTLAGKVLDSAWAAGGATVDDGAGIAVNPGDKLTVTSVWQAANNSRMGFRVFGGGTAEYAPAVLAFATADNTFTILLEGNGTTLTMNQLPSRRSQNNAASGVLEVRVLAGQTNTFNMLDEPTAPEVAEPANFKTRYGFQQFQVFGTGTVGSAGTFILNIKEGAMFKTTGRPNQFHSMVSDGATMIVNLEGPNSRFYQGGTFSGGVAGPGAGTLVIRGRGTMGWGDVGVSANQRYIGPNLSVVFDGGTWNCGGIVDIGRVDANLTFNQDLAGSADVPRILSMAVGGAGNTTWNGLVEKAGSSADTWTLSRTGGVVSVSANAALAIGGGTMSVGGTTDPFTDSVDTTRHLSITNNALLTFTNTNGVRHVGLLAGTGTVTVANGCFFRLDAVAPGMGGLGRLAVSNAGPAAATVLDREAGATSVFEVNPANTNSDLFKVVGGLAFGGVGPNVSVHLAVAPGSPTPGRVIQNIEVMNATSILDFEAVPFNLTADPAFPAGGTLRIRKAAGSGGGESLYLDFVRNLAPVAADDSASAPTNATVAIAVLDNDADADGDPLTVSACTQGANGSVGIGPGATNVTYTPNPDWRGTDTFQYTVSDGYTGVATGTVTVLVDDMWSLQVASDAGASVPAPGLHYFLKDSNLTASVTGDVVVAGGVTQYVGAGWIGTGSVTSGVGTQVSFTLTNDSTIAWLWVTNVLFRRAAAPNGAVSGDTNGWYAPGASVTVTATPAVHFDFGGWSGAPAGQTLENPLTLVLDQTHSVTGRFTARLAPQDTPEWWLAQHGLTNGTTDFAQAETNDTDKDLFSNAFEYVAGTDPTNEWSYLGVTALSNAPNNRVYFTTVSGRRYDLQRCTDLTGQDWSAVAGQSNKVGNGGSLWLVESNAASRTFYRIGVRME